MKKRLSRLRDLFKNDLESLKEEHKRLILKAGRIKECSIFHQKKIVQKMLYIHITSEYSLPIDEINKSACKGKGLIHDKRLK